MGLVKSCISLILLVQVVCAVKHGVIGFGITMYKPVCCYACHDSLSSLYLNCTIFSEDIGDGMSMKLRKRTDMTMMGSTSDACFATSQPWLQSLGYCIQQRCSVDNVGTSSQDRCFQNVAASGISVPTLEDAVPSHPPVLEAARDAIWLNETLLVNADLYEANYETLKEFEDSEDRHTRFSVIILALAVGTCVLGGILRLLKSKFPKISILPSSVSTVLQTYIGLPALAGGRHLQPLPYNIGYLPSRVLSLFIAIYVILNVLFCCVDYHNAWPNTWYSDKRSEMAAYVSNRTGVLSFANIALAILFSGRNNLLIALTGWSQTTFLTFHRWASRVATSQAVVHSIIYTLTYFWSGGAADYYAEAAQAYYWWGIIATVALCLATALALLPIRLRLYELFLVTHIVLVILVLVGCWYHIDLRFSKKWGYEVWLYLAFAFWAADRFARFARLIVLNRKGMAAVTTELLPGSKFVHITIYPRVTWNFAPGQHIFMYIPHLGKFWENHPFSLASWNMSNELDAHLSPSKGEPVTSSDKSVRAAVMETLDTEKSFQSQVAPVSQSESDTMSQSSKITQNQSNPSISILVRIHGGMTSSLQEHLLSSTTIPPAPLSVVLEGPYGGHTLPSIQNADTILCLAGGIGITNSLSYIRSYVSEQSLAPGNRRMRQASRMVLAWSMKEPELLAYVCERLLLSEPGSVECKFWCTGEEGERGARMDIGEVIDGVKERGKRIAIVMCGPGGMADEARAAVVGLVREGMTVDLIEEAFAW